MDLKEYKRRLLEREQELLREIERATDAARGQRQEPARDIGDESVSDELKEEQFRDADADWALLKQIRDAVRRIENGTFGRCVVDGGPIEEKRLQAMPWTAYCLKHQQELEGSRPPRIATL